MATRLRGLERFAPLAGIVFVALLILSFVIGGDPPDVDESTTEVAQFWADDEDAQIASAVIGALAVVFLLWFLGSLRSALRSAEGLTGRLSAVAFAGGLILAVGGVMNSAVQFAAADTAAEVPAAVTHSLAALLDGLWIPFPVGIGTLFLATGVLAVRSGVLPVWLGALTIVLGIAALTPIGWVVFFAFLAWVVVMSVLMFLGRLGVPDTAGRGGVTAPPPPPPAVTPPPPPTVP
jgi:hypothetical protein